MKINWSVRFKNPVFWVNIAISVITPMLVYTGLSWSEITTWGAFGNLFVQAVTNPVVLSAVAVSVWNAINDPTTEGYSDSTQALTYTVPKSK